MAAVVIEPYVPEMFRKWHDGPVYILDLMCAIINPGHATYVAFQYITDIEEFIDEHIPRPFAGTIYLIVPANYHKRMNDKFSELDIRMLKM